MSTGWTRATQLMASLAVVAFGAMAVGCGPAPGYEPEPRMPSGYTSPPEGGGAEPLAAEELAAQNEARAQASGEIAIGAETDEYADTDPSALTEFKPSLDGHGVWVDDATYGTLWVPSEAEVGTDFVPYTTAGHWTYDDSTSWVWVSDYAWGWAPFHYGRWVHVSRHGWAWIPGRAYSGAWVTWRSGPGYDYVGWAPTGPDWYWSNGYAVGWTYGYTPSYSYCHHHHIYGPGVSSHVVRGVAAREHERRTQPHAGANPSVGDARGPNGRVAASPSVGSGRVAASPSVGSGRALANPNVGPRPVELGIKNELVVAPPGDHPGLARARGFASPQTAVSQGASPPFGVRAWPPTESIAVLPRPSFESRGPMASRYEAAARAPQYQGVIPVPPRQAALPEMRPSARTFSTPPGFSASSVAAQPPAFRSPSSFSTSPTYRTPAPNVASPPPSFRSSSSPSIASSPPSFRSSSSPNIRSTPSTPTFRSSPSVSSPSVRATPSPARPAMPSRSAGAAIRSRR